MIRAALLSTLVATACDSTVIVQDGGAGANGAGGDATSSTGTGFANSSSAAPAWTVPPDRTYSHIACGDEEDEPLLFIEIWPAGENCIAQPTVEDVLVLGILNWDGEPGTFVLGVETPHGTAQAGMSGLSLERTTGTITVEPYVGTPSAIAWDLSIGAGRTDLSVCGHFDDFPCE
jgi:hypothetical protein